MAKPFNSKTNSTKNEEILNETCIILYNFFDTLKFEDDVLRKIIIKFKLLQNAKNLKNTNRGELIDAICRKVVFLLIKTPSYQEEDQFDLHIWLKTLMDDYYWGEKGKEFNDFMFNINSLKQQKNPKEIKKNKKLILETIRGIKGDKYVS